MKKFLIFLFILNILFYISFFLILPKFSSKEIKMMDLKKLKLEEAIEKLNDYNLKYEILYLPSSEEVILNHIPHDDMMIKKDTKVILYCGKRIYEPHFINLNYELVRNLINDFLNEYDLNLKIIENGSLEKGIIFDEKIDYDSNTLVLEIGGKEEGILMPNLIFQNISKAIDFSNLYHVKFIYEYKESAFESDTIIYQELSPLTKIYNLNQEIKIIISK